MRAMIFAAGLGTRLKPWTERHPKALVPVGGVPMLERVINKLKGAGITEMVVNVHHFADQIIDFLGDNGNFGCDIHISDESGLLLDTGGGILAARHWLEPGDEPFVVHNADILTDFDLAGMIEAHNRNKAIATLLVAPRETSRYLLFDSELRMHGWTNVTTGQVRPATLDHNPEISEGAPGTLLMLAFGGVHILSPEIFGPLAAYRGPGLPFSITDFYIDSCATQLIRGYQVPAPYRWHDIGKPASLAAADESIATNL